MTHLVTGKAGEEAKCPHPIPGSLSHEASSVRERAGRRKREMMEQLRNKQEQICREQVAVRKP